jgi:hypothetical protein
MKPKQEIFGNNGTWTEQVQLQEELQNIGYNIVSCCTCSTIFIHRNGADIEYLICPYCGTEAELSNFSDLFYNGMPEAD